MHCARVLRRSIPIVHLHKIHFSGSIPLLISEAEARATSFSPSKFKSVRLLSTEKECHSPTQSLNARAVEKRKTGGKEKNPPPPLATRSMIAIALPSLSSPLDHSRVETEIFLRRSSSQTLCLRIARTAKRSSSSILYPLSPSQLPLPLSRSSRLTLFNLLN